MIYEFIKRYPVESAKLNFDTIRIIQQNTVNQLTKEAISYDLSHEYNSNPAFHGLTPFAPNGLNSHNTLGPISAQHYHIRGKYYHNSKKKIIEKFGCQVL